MRDQLGDALLRYTFARDNLAAVDKRIQAARLDSHVCGATRLTAQQQQQLAQLLDDECLLSEKFGHAAMALALSLRSASHHDQVHDSAREQAHKPTLHDQR